MSGRAVSSSAVCEARPLAALEWCVEFVGTWKAHEEGALVVALPAALEALPFDELLRVRDSLRGLAVLVELEAGSRR